MWWFLLTSGYIIDLGIHSFYYWWYLDGFIRTRCVSSHLSISKSLSNQLSIHLFLAKQEKLCSNSLASNLANLPPPRAYLRAERERTSLVHPASCAYLSGALRFLAGLFVCLAGLFLFYQVQMTNSWRESIFSLAIYFSKLPNHDICQVNFGKLLEMIEWFYSLLSEVWQGRQSKTVRFYD
jgi:hypothetical protein